MNQSPHGNGPFALKGSHDFAVEELRDYVRIVQHFDQPSLYNLASSFPDVIARGP